MLRNKYRAGRQDIEDTIKFGVTISENFLYAKISRKDGEKPGFAIVVSKKIEKTSVGRHRMKRKISAAIEENLKKDRCRFQENNRFLSQKDRKADFL